MKKVKGLICVAAALLTIASCNKTPVGDAQVGFTSELNEFCLEDGPNYDIPVSIKGDDISYPVTLKITHVDGEGTTFPDTPYSERNVEYRFLDRELVIESPEDVPVVTVRQLVAVDTLYVGVKLEIVSNCATLDTYVTELVALPEVCYHEGDYTANVTSVGGKSTYDEMWSIKWITEVYEGQLIYNGPAIYGYMGTTEENGGYPMYVQTGRLDLGGEYGEVFAIQMPFDGSVYVAAGELSLNQDNPNEKTLCVLCPCLYQDEIGPYFGPAFMVEVAEDELAVLYNPYDSTIEAQSYLSAAWFNYETGAFVRVYDLITVNGNVTKGFTKSAIMEQNPDFVPYTGKLERKQFHL